jgi:hypothetical protein
MRIVDTVERTAQLRLNSGAGRSSFPENRLIPAAAPASAGISSLALTREMMGWGVQVAGAGRRADCFGARLVHRGARVARDRCRQPACAIATAGPPPRPLRRAARRTAWIEPRQRRADPGRKRSSTAARASRAGRRARGCPCPRLVARARCGLRLSSAFAQGMGSGATLSLALSLVRERD